MVVIAVEELNFLERPGAGQVADDRRVHEKKQIESRRAWDREGGGSPNGGKTRDKYRFSRVFAQKVTFKRPVLSRVRMISLNSVRYISRGNSLCVSSLSVFMSLHMSMPGLIPVLAEGQWPDGRARAELWESGFSLPPGVR